MNSTTTTSKTASQGVFKPFTTAVLGSDVNFWRSYIAGRPVPSDGFFDLINDYHQSHGEHGWGVAHDVGTGPGNIAERLTKYYDHVVGSDVNGEALSAARALIASETLRRMTIVETPAEEVASGVIPQDVGVGNTDLVVVSECMPLLDPVSSVQAFGDLLRPSGTLAIYFYGRPLFVDGNKDECDTLYDRIATRICSFLHPFKGTPGFPFQERAAMALLNWLDNIEIPSDTWYDVQRYKWNSDRPLLFNSESGYDFEIKRVDRRSEGEINREVIDRSYWQVKWDVEQVAAFLASVYPNYHKKAGERMEEVNSMLKELGLAMGGPRDVSFTVSLILATKR